MALRVGCGAGPAGGSGGVYYEVGSSGAGAGGVGVRGRWYVWRADASVGGMAGGGDAGTVACIVYGAHRTICSCGWGSGERARVAIVMIGSAAEWRFGWGGGSSTI